MARFDLKKLLASGGLTDSETKDLTPDQQAFIHDWRHQQSLKALRSFSLVTCFTSILGALGSFTIAPLEFEWPCFMMSLLVGIGSIVTVFMLDRQNSQTSFGLKAHLVIGNILTLIGFCILLQFTITAPHASRSFLILNGIVWVTMLWYVGTLGQLFGPHIILMKSILLVPPLAIYHFNDGAGMIPLLIAIILTDIYVLIFNYFFNLRSQRHALLELKSQELSVQNERLQIKAIESELSLAHELQQNLSRPHENVTHGDKLITIIQSNGTKLGGDWVAARILPDGRYVVAVGDGTGKGVPAAMVVQTVQALWVAGLSDMGWHPLAWFHSVNRTLRTMGRQHPHTLTIGLIVIDEHEATYYSAGPMPLFMVGDSRIAESTKIIVGDGHLLGIYSEPQVKPIRISLPEYTPYALMLATDGIIPKRALAKEHRMYDVLSQVSVSGKAAIKNIQSEEDKILVLIRRAETLKAAS